MSESLSNDSFEWIIHSKKWKVTLIKKKSKNKDHWESFLKINRNFDHICVTVLVDLQIYLEVYIFTCVLTLPSGFR